MKKEYSREEIIARLKWFHGDDFEKYPLVEEEEKARSLKSTVD